MATNIKGVTGLTGRYASALFDLADDNNVLDDVDKYLSFLQELIDESVTEEMFLHLSVFLLRKDGF